MTAGVTETHAHRLRKAHGARHPGGRAHLHGEGLHALRARRRPRPRSDRTRTSSPSSMRRTSRCCRRSPPCSAIPASGRAISTPASTGSRSSTASRASTLHPPLEPRGTVIGKTRIIEVIDKGAGQRRADLHRAQDHRQGERRADRDRDADHFLPRRRRLRRAAAREPAAAPDPGARARSRLRSRHAAGDGADLSAVTPTSIRCTPIPPSRRRPAFRGRSCTGSAPSASPATRAEERVRLRSGALDRRSAGVSPRRCFRARPSAPRCGATATW